MCAHTSKFTLALEFNIKCKTGINATLRLRNQPKPGIVTSSVYHHNATFCSFPCLVTLRDIGQEFSKNGGCGQFRQSRLLGPFHIAQIGMDLQYMWDGGGKREKVIPMRTAENHTQATFKNLPFWTCSALNGLKSKAGHCTSICFLNKENKWKRRCSFSMLLIKHILFAQAEKDKIVWPCTWKIHDLKRVKSLFFSAWIAFSSSVSSIKQSQFEISSFSY